MTDAGRAMLAQDPDCPGSLGLAISEAVEEAVKSGGEAKYSLGSVLNHVILHQTIVGLETKNQFEKMGITPDILIGCVGGGSNAMAKPTKTGSITLTYQPKVFLFSIVFPSFKLN